MYNYVQLIQNSYEGEKPEHLTCLMGSQTMVINSKKEFSTADPDRKEKE